MQRHAPYQPYAAAPPAPAPAAPTHRYSGTSSAFSASANPHEDWTKISDLAERRRIQNRIAQRNYRKKLKKRLEDLERRAASSSASPEQKPAQLAAPQTSPRQEFPSPASSESEFGPRTPEMQSHQYVPTSEERGMFSHQYTRQLSTSPPPFSYSTYPDPASSAAYTVPYSNHTPYHSIPTTITPEMTTYAPYLPPLSSASYPTTLPSLAPTVKSEYYNDDDCSPFGGGYAMLAGTNEVPHHAYPESNANTPPLYFDHSQAGSPPQYPATPNSMPRTPPLQPIHVM